MTQLVYALDTLALVRAVVVGLEGLGVPDTDIHLAAPPASDLDAAATLRATAALERHCVRTITRSWSCGPPVPRSHLCTRLLSAGC